jgi:hypothetical protein
MLLSLLVCSLQTVPGHHCCSLLLPVSLLLSKSPTAHPIAATAGFGTIISPDLNAVLEASDGGQP